MSEPEPEQFIVLSAEALAYVKALAQNPLFSDPADEDPREAALRKEVFESAGNPQLHPQLHVGQGVLVEAVANLEKLLHRTHSEQDELMDSLGDQATWTHSPGYYTAFILLKDYSWIRPVFALTEERHFKAIVKALFDAHDPVHVTNLKPANPDDFERASVPTLHVEDE